MAYIGTLLKGFTDWLSRTARTGAFLNLFILSVVFTISNESRADLNLSEVNPAPQSIQRQTFPRSNTTLYRGTNENQFNYVRAVRAMVGDITAPLESPMYYSVREALQGHNSSLFRKITGLQDEYIANNFSQLVEAKKASNNAKPLGEIEAFQAAIEVMDSVYTPTYANSRIYNYLSPYRDDFPKAFLYSTVHIEVAKIYSPHIVIIKEKRPRSLDVNYWNKVNNGKWVHTNLSYPDRGEFITAYYIPAKDIIGYQMARSQHNDVWNVWRDLSPDLGLVFMRKDVNKNSYVYLFDARGLQHVVEQNGEFCSAVSTFNPREEIPTFPQVDCSVKPKLISILTKCAEGESANSKNCQVPPQLFKGYPVSDLEAQEEIKNLTRIELFKKEKIVNFPASNNKRSQP